MRIVIILLLVHLFFSPFASGEPVRAHRRRPTCGFPSPTLEARDAVEARLFLQANFSPASEAKTPPIVVPVAFHIIQNSRGANTATASAIADQIDQLNASFRGLFRFETILIETVVNDTWFLLHVGTQDDSNMGAALRVGDARTLNVYLNESYLEAPGDILGVARYPTMYTGSPKEDGVQIHHTTLPGGSAFERNRGKVLVHEVGHWLGLFHTFQPLKSDKPVSFKNNGCRGKGDRIADTPAEREPHFTCRSTDSCPQLGRDPIHNYMNYTGDICARSFTPAQKSRMRMMYQAYRNSGSSAG